MIPPFRRKNRTALKDHRYRGKISNPDWTVTARCTAIHTRALFRVALLSRSQTLTGQKKVWGNSCFHVPTLLWFNHDDDEADPQDRWHVQPR